MKDAKGHGSDPRGGAFNEPRKGFTLGQDKAHEKMLAQTLTMPSAMRGVMGGPSPEQAEAQLRYHYGYSDSDVAKLKTGNVSGRVDQMTDRERLALSANDHARETNEYNRDLALRSRNGQVGSGMKFRG